MKKIIIAFIASSLTTFIYAESTEAKRLHWSNDGDTNILLRFGDGMSFEQKRIA